MASIKAKGNLTKPDTEASPEFRRTQRRNVSIGEHENVDQGDEFSGQELIGTEEASVEEKVDNAAQVPSSSLSEDIDKNDSIVALVGSLEGPSLCPTTNAEKPRVRASNNQRKSRANSD